MKLTKIANLLNEIKILPAYWRAVSLAKISCLIPDLQSKLSLIDEAQKALNGLDDVYLHSLALSEIASIVYPIDKDSSIRLFNEAFKQSLTLRDEERDASLEWIVHYSTDVGNHNLARKLVKEIKNSFYKDISYLCISRSLAKNSMISASLEVLDKIESSYFKALAKACIANEVYPSEKSLSESLFASIMRDLDNLDCFNVVCLLSHTLYLREKFMERRLTIQMLNKAMNALKKLKHKQLHDIASARLIPSLLKHSKYAEVEKILSLIQDPFYASLARVRISFVLMSRKKDLAFKFLSSLRMKGIQGSYKEIIRAEKARLMALGGKLEEAVRLAREIEDEGYRGVAIKNIVDALVEKERVMITELLKV